MSRWPADIIYRWRFPLCAVILLGAAVSIPYANITKIDNDITAWFSREDPVYKDYERLRAEFGGTRSLIIALRADSPDRLFSMETLNLVHEITADIERVSTVQRVASLDTATIVQATPDGGLDVRPLLDKLHSAGDSGQAAQTVAEIRRLAMHDEMIRGDLVSDDGRVTALVVTFDEDRIDEVRSGVIQQIHDVVDPKLPPGVTAYYNGSLEISETYNRVTLDNQRKFIPPILLFTLFAIYATFRSVRKTALAMFAVGVSVLWTLGLFALMGFTYNILASMLVPLIVVLAIADDVHIMQHWDEERRHLDDEGAFKATVSHLAAPLLGASGTTALGMLSLATSSVVAVRAFGIGSAVGIMVDFAISLVLMPTLLTLVRPETAEAPHEKYLVAPLQRVARFSCAYPKRVIWVSLAVGLVAALGMLRLRVDTNHINFFDREHPLGRSARVIDQDLSGVYSFQIMLEGAPESMKTPDALRRIDRLEEELRRFPHVRKVTSVADYVMRINKELNDGRPDAHVVPASGDTIAQELFVFALGGEGRHELERVVASDYSRAQISIKLQSMSSDVVLAQVEAADRLAKATFQGTGIAATTTGSGRLFSTLDHYLVVSQLSSFGTAFITVFAVIFVVFRSARFGLLTIIPNVLPVLAVLGIMGYLDISMNVATIMVASVALGVVDDDTIHFINRYRRETAAGKSTEEAIEIATAHEGRASLTTAFINSCGYGVLLLSEYKPTAWFGGLLALTMGVAFLAEVFILPATIKLLPGVYGADALRRRRLRKAAVACLAPFALLVIPSPAHAQLTRPTGYASVLADVFPNRDKTMELRARLFVEEKADVRPTIRITASGYAEGLWRTDQLTVPSLRGGRARSEREQVRAALFRLQDANIEFRRDRVDLVAGLARVAWGRLDELQPTDVVNPLDVSKFFLEGRSEARLAVGMVRARAFLSEDASIEAVVVPFFRRGRFDQLDEETSPFNITSGAAVVGEKNEPARTPGNVQAGARFSATSGRVDWSVSAFRGLEPFALYGVPHAPTPLGAPPLIVVRESFPRFTMIGGDFETVRGQWGLRGEVAAFLEDSFQDPALRIVPGNSVDAGVGLDRKAGDYRISGTVLLHAESYDSAIDSGKGPETGRQNVSLIVSADRSFARERYDVRVFGVYDPDDSSSFVRAILRANVRDNLALEGSVGWFASEGRDLVGRFADSDFLYLRLKYHF